MKPCVEITVESDQRVRAFLRTMSDACKTCLRRVDFDCRNCTASWAKNVLTDYVHGIEDLKLSKRGKYRDNDGTLDARIARITQFIEEKDRPVLCNEIPMAEFGSRSLKEFTLRKMIEVGILSREKDGNNYRYFLTTTKKDETNGNECVDCWEEEHPSDTDDE